MTLLLTLRQTNTQTKTNKNRQIRKYNQMKNQKTEFLPAVQRKKLSRYKLKKQVTFIEKILLDPQIMGV